MARERVDLLRHQAADNRFRRVSLDWFEASCRLHYSYQFDWLGRPIIQYPQDVVALQEIMWAVRPRAVIECGIAHGGSLILTASMLALIDYCEAVETGDTSRLALLDPHGSRVVGVDIDIRLHNRDGIDRHPLRHKIRLVEGSSVEPSVVDTVRAEVGDLSPVLVLLDSNHSADHVRRELAAYADLVTVGSYCIVYDTVIDHLPSEMHEDRPWGPGDSPATAVEEFLRENPDFQADTCIDDRLALSVAPRGYLRRIAC